MQTNLENKIAGIILAGGRGSRLSKFTDEIPKPMIPILGKPVMEYQIEKLKEYGIKDIYVTVGYLKDKIIDYFGDGQKFGCKITYIKEDEPLGSCGAFYYLKDKIQMSAFVVCGDVLFNLNIKKFYEYHKSKAGYITITAHPNSHPYDSDLVILENNYDEYLTLSDYIKLGYTKEELYANNDKTLDSLNSTFYRNIFESKAFKDLIIDKSKKSNLVLKFDKKENASSRTTYHNLVNAGICFIEPKAFEYFEKPEKKDLEKDLIAHFINMSKVYAYRTVDYIKDMGTYDRLDIAEEDVKLNKLDPQLKKKAVFLDRDGTINVFKYPHSDKSSIELLDRAASAIKLFNKAGYVCILVTNQPSISKGFITFDDLDEVNKKLETLLGSEGAFLDDIYFCPHHQEYGKEGENPEYKIVCNCRKPNTGMIDKAVETYDIDKNLSYMIGDSSFDINLGKNANMKMILVETGLGGEDKELGGYYHFAKDLYEAAEFILNENNIKIN